MATIVHGPAGMCPTRLGSTATSETFASASMWRSRSGGPNGSTGRYAHPVCQAPRAATIICTELFVATAIGALFVAIDFPNEAAKADASEMSSAKVSRRESDTIAIASGRSAACCRIHAAVDAKGFAPEAVFWVAERAALRLSDITVSSKNAGARLYADSKADCDSHNPGTTCS